MSETATKTKIQFDGKYIAKLTITLLAITAVAAFLLAALTGGRLAGWLQKKGLGRSLMVKKGESVTPGQENAPEFGALPLLIGLVPASLLALLILLISGGSLSPGIEAGKVLAVLFSAALYAAVGLTDDWRRGNRMPEMPLFFQIQLPGKTGTENCIATR